MADVEDGGQFLERGIGLCFNLVLKFLGIERAPLPPARFGGERARLGGGQIAINRAQPNRKAQPAATLEPPA